MTERTMSTARPVTSPTKQAPVTERREGAEGGDRPVTPPPREGL
jgi:hypothetical protein